MYNFCRKRFEDSKIQNCCFVDKRTKVFEVDIYATFIGDYDDDKSASNFLLEVVFIIYLFKDQRSAYLAMSFI